MRSTIVLSVVAAAAVSALDCNPTYNVATSGTCFTGCNVKAGSTYLSGWTMDHTSDKFLASLKIMCVKGTVQYTAFMTTAGMCMAGCSDAQELFIAEFAGACAWYDIHKSDTCSADAVVATTTPSAETTTTATASAETTTAATASAEATTTATASAETTTAATASGTSSFVSHTGAPASAATAIASGASSSVVGASQASAATSQPASAASKMQIGGYAMALVACASYFAL